MRDGRVPKMQKNLEKQRKEAAYRQAKQEGWLADQAKLKQKEKEERQRAERAKRPMKIRAGAYGPGMGGNKAVIHEAGKQSKEREHIFF